MTEEKKGIEKALPDLGKLAETPPKSAMEAQFDIPGLLPILPMSEINLFPKMIFPMIVLDQGAMAVIQDCMAKNRMIGLFSVKDGTDKKEGFDREDLHEVGIAAYVLKMSRADDGSMRVLAQGMSRIRYLETVETDPFLLARIEALGEEYVMDQEMEALMSNVRGSFTKVLELSPNLPAELSSMNQHVEHPGLLADIVASALNLKKGERQELISAVDVKTRLKKVLLLLQGNLDILELGSRIQSQIKGKIEKSHKDYYLREQLKAIQEELGEQDETTVELDELGERLAAKALPEDARTAADRELNRLRRMNPASAEYTVSRTYLDWILDLPWLEVTPDRLDIKAAQEVLEADHFGLEKIKKRIVEYLAVRQLKPDLKGPILCFAGPPGTGKTSLGKSIARALGRKFIRISLGGVRDEAEIRGHRRTYVGALPGRIIQGIKKAGYSNPVFMLDEVDKLGTDFRGDPSSALLEVLDPEQNFSFSDHYLEVEYDLSKVVFILTANMLDNIPGPLRDRMEVITLSGYTSEEKLLIAKKYLVPRQREAHGLTGRNIIFRDGAIKLIITHYTREAGLRNLEREIANVCRGVATEVVSGNVSQVVVKAVDVTTLLGPPRFESEVRARTAQAGVATGLAWTQSGGDILFVEATAMPGRGALTLTGQLGDVMKESVQAALSYVRSRSADFKLDDAYFSSRDIHVHVPAGAIPKDGPSAGVTMVSAIVSLVTGRRIRPEVAMTGEITLRGLVLPVGGIKEKVLAAKRAGIKQVILPRRNEHDVLEISESLRRGLDIRFADKIDDVLAMALK